MLGHHRDELPRLPGSLGFIAAENFHLNSFHRHTQDYQVAEERPAVHQFVARLLALLDGEPK